MVMRTLVLLEAAGTLSEGLLFGLGLAQIARALQAPVVLVHGWQDSRSADALLEARQQLGDLLAGVVLNAVSPELVSQLRQEVDWDLGLVIVTPNPLTYVLMPLATVSRWLYFRLTSRAKAAG